MDIKAAQQAIEAILASIPDDELPKFDRVEQCDGTTTVWWGGTGHYLGSARTGERRSPINHRHRAAWEAIEGEMTYRADQKFFDNGDKLDGLRIAAKKGGR